MKTWKEFAELRPDLAEPGQALLYRVGVGLGFLATTRPDGAPRLHPMCPLLAGDGVYAFIVPSPKQRDLRRDGRYAIHSFPTPSNEDAFYFSGRARLVDDVLLRASLSEQFVVERESIGVEPPPEHDQPFEFLLDTAFHTVTIGHGDPNPVHHIWRDA
jgi:hypothetical protein